MAHPSKRSACGLPSRWTLVECGRYRSRFYLTVPSLTWKPLLDSHVTGNTICAFCGGKLTSGEFEWDCHGLKMMNPMLADILSGNRDIERHRL
jgi:hypothetical protein